MLVMKNEWINSKIISVFFFFSLSLPLSLSLSLSLTHTVFCLFLFLPLFPSPRTLIHFLSNFLFVNGSNVLLYCFVGMAFLLRPNCFVHHTIHIFMLPLFSFSFFLSYILFCLSSTTHTNTHHTHTLSLPPSPSLPLSLSLSLSFSFFLSFFLPLFIYIHISHPPSRSLSFSSVSHYRSLHQMLGRVRIE
jgi:hypothetical protein